MRRFLFSAFVLSLSGGGWAQPVSQKSPQGRLDSGLKQEIKAHPDAYKEALNRVASNYLQQYANPLQQVFRERVLAQQPVLEQPLMTSKE